MPKLAPPPRTKAEDKAISQAIRRDKKERKQEKAAAKPRESVLALVVAAGAIGTLAFYGLSYLNRNDDMQPIQPPEPPRPLAPAVHPKTKPPPAGAKGNADTHPARPGDEKPADGKAQPHLSAEAADARPGLFAVTCNPECDIEIDGHPSGKRSPQSGMPIPAGPHKIKLVNPQLKLSVTDSVTIAADALTTRHYNLVLGMK